MMPPAPARGPVRRKSRPALAGEIYLGPTSLFDTVESGIVQSTVARRLHYWPTARIAVNLMMWLQRVGEGLTFRA